MAEAPFKSRQLLRCAGHGGESCDGQEQLVREEMHLKVARLELSLDGFLRLRHTIDATPGRQTAMAVVLQKPAPSIVPTVASGPVATDKPVTLRKPICAWVTA